MVELVGIKNSQAACVNSDIGWSVDEREQRLKVIQGALGIYSQINVRLSREINSKGFHNDVFHTGMSLISDKDLLQQ